MATATAVAATSTVTYLWEGAKFVTSTAVGVWSSSKTIKKSAQETGVACKAQNDLMIDRITANFQQVASQSVQAINRQTVETGSKVLTQLCQTGASLRVVAGALKDLGTMLTSANKTVMERNEINREKVEALKQGATIEAAGVCVLLALAFNEIAKRQQCDAFFNDFRCSLLSSTILLSSAASLALIVTVLGRKAFGK